MKSKIKKLLKDEKSVLVFDVDGVLAPIEYGEYNHYYYDDEEWAKAIDSGKDFYADVKPFKTIKEENCYMVFKDRDKLLLLEEIKEKYPDLDDHQIVFIEDTVDNLSYVMDNSNYSTVHISSFMK